MMTVIKVAALCVAVALMCATIKVARPDMAIVLSIAAGCVAIVLSLEYVSSALDEVNALSATAGLESGAFSIMLKATGIAILSEFASSVCKDAGESALALRVEFCARAALLAMCLPLLTGIIDKLSRLLP